RIVPRQQPDALPVRADALESWHVDLGCTAQGLLQAPGAHVGAPALALLVVETDRHLIAVLIEQLVVWVHLAGGILEDPVRALDQVDLHHLAACFVLGSGSEETADIQPGLARKLTRPNRAA